jgi:hypothetical protein
MLKDVRQPGGLGRHSLSPAPPPRKNIPNLARDRAGHTLEGQTILLATLDERDYVITG